MDMSTDGANNVMQMRFTETNWSIIRRRVKGKNEVGSWNQMWMLWEGRNVKPCCIWQAEWSEEQN